ncbi:MAG: hypothetical protein ACMG6S_29840, partial [Byssovorax sp.]
MASFYLAGTAKADIQRVQPIIVRTTTPWLLGGSDPPTCATVGRHLGLGDGDATALPPLPSGVTTSAIFNANAPKWDVLVPTPWERPAKEKNEDEAFKIFVGADDFLVPGANYCVFIYKEVKTKKVDATTAAGILEKLSNDLNGCENKQPYGVLDACVNQAHTLFDTSISGLPLDQSAKAKLKEAAKDLWEPMRAMEASKDRIQKLLTSWHNSLPTGSPTVVKKYDPPLAYLAVRPPPEDAAQQLGPAIADLLAQRQKLLKIKGAGAGVEYTTWGNATPVVQLHLATDFENIVVWDKVGKGAKPISLAIGAKDLTLPETSVTLLDLLELSRSRLRLGDEYVSVGTLEQRLKPILDKRVDLAPGDRDTLVALQQRLHAFSRYVRKALLARGANLQPVAPAPPGTPALPVAPKPPIAPKPPVDKSLDTLLGNWLSTIVGLCDQSGVQIPLCMVVPVPVPVPV